jgi:hypothetical protein
MTTNPGDLPTEVRDPDELLAEVREAVRRFARYTGECEPGGKLMVAFLKLDEHMTAGGPPPAAWPTLPVSGSDLTEDASDQEQEIDPEVIGTPFPGRTGYVTGRCGHAVAGSEWEAGYRVCERCPCTFR